MLAQFIEYLNIQTIVYSMKIQKLSLHYIYYIPNLGETILVFA